MSQKDLQFIERALAHPWMFWVYFWKWPRIVRQACAEYDLLAKERDAAKAAHERSERANKIVRDWIHVTHRLSTTPEAIRAIFAAGKRLSILLVFFVVTNTYGQAPPYLRNQWTTNANPLALKVVSTNGVSVATNVWELDFTNTATVTVSAVSNANKVMVSFTGSASSGSSSLTNALLHAGPTNGSVDALILTAGNGVTLTTSGTNRIAAIDTNVVAEISDLIWTNNGTFTTIVGQTNHVRHYSNYTEYGTNLQSVTISNRGVSTIAHLYGATPANSPGSYVEAKHSSFAAGAFYFSTNCSIANSDGGLGGGWFEFSSDCQATSFDGSFAGIFGERSTNCQVDASASAAEGYFEDCSNVEMHAVNGSMALGNFADATNCTFYVQYGAGFANMQGTSNSLYSSQSFVFGISDDGTMNERVHGERQAFVFGRNLSGTNNWSFGLHGTNSTPFSFALVNNGVQFQVTSNGNPGTIRGVSGYSWPTAHAAGVWTNDGAGVTGWKPLSDFVSGGGGIASIYTNNVLAGGPGLTELEFTNTATVTWAATTNAGRVTMSATSAGGGSGIATNEGTGFKTTFYGQTNFGNITFTNNARIEQPTATITRFTNSNFDFGGALTATPDNTHDFGVSAAGTFRFRNIYAGTTFFAGINVRTPVIKLNELVHFYAPATGVLTLYQQDETSFGRIQFGGTTANFPAIAKTNAHLAIVDATRAVSTNMLIFGNTVNTTASTGMTMNRQTGRVRLSAGNQTYLVTNNLATVNSIVTATINSDDTTALNVKAIPAAGLITLKANAATTADTDISFFISSP